MPRFVGHYQPHLPGEQLGLYDLSDASVRERQAELARAHGVDGFVYFHYWYRGRRILGRPLDETLNSRRPDFPFCLCWVNQDWTLATDGAVPRILLEQTYAVEDDLEHIRWLARAFADARYIRVNGRPLLLVYRAWHLPDPRRTTDAWRSEAQRLGIGDIYVVRVEAFPQDRADPVPLGFDAAVEFQPDLWMRSPQLVTSPEGPADERAVLSRYPAAGGVFSYPAAVELALNSADPPYKRYRCLMPGWDNSASRPSSPTIFAGATPRTFERWLAETVARFRPYSTEENLVFVNAWNAWRDGCHLEPDRRWGTAFLDAHLRGTGRDGSGVSG